MLSHHKPAPPLDRFVECLWLWDGVARPHALERILPDGSMQIVVNLAEDRIPLYDRHTGAAAGGTRGALLCGPRTGYSVIDTATQLSVFGFHFKPGGLLPFLRMPLDELRDLELGLDFVWGRGAAELRDRLLEAPTAAAKFHAAERWLAGRAVREFARHPAVGFALSEIGDDPAASVAGIVERTGMPWRRFGELFRAEVGMAPKAFARVRRFQLAVRRIGGSAAAVDWAALALDCGYYDQGHFIHDFRAFAGLTPAAYLRARTEHLNHVPFDPEAANFSNTAAAGSARMNA
jgi:methylphosphotriester-DNA--protein-cysteine methyltransferase